MDSNAPTKSNPAGGIRTRIRLQGNVSRQRHRNRGQVDQEDTADHTPVAPTRSLKTPRTEIINMIYHLYDLPRRSLPLSIRWYQIGNAPGRGRAGRRGDLPSGQHTHGSARHPSR